MWHETALMSTSCTIDYVQSFLNLKRIQLLHLGSMPDTLPQVFEPLNLRKKAFYRNLSVGEKKFIASEAARITSMLTWDLQKYTVLQRICNRYTLPVSTVRDWMNKVAGSLAISNKIGRPSSMDTEAIEKL
jgi:hypothetical protein